MNNCKDIRNKFIDLYVNKKFVTDKTNVKTLEIIGATFVVDEEYIIKEPSYEYIQREIQWYRSQSLYVDDIPGKTPIIWEQVSSEHGRINSNYGYVIWSKENGEQYKNVLEQLKANANTRRATMIYNRPSMHTDYAADGMNDFICTYANTFYIRDNKLVSHFLMRATDAIFGANNDFAWAKHVQKQLLNDLKDIYPNLELGDLIWTSSNIHVYERHFKFIEKLIEEENNNE